MSRRPRDDAYATSQLRSSAWEAGAQPPKGGTPAVEAGARPRSPQMIEKIGGRDRDRTGDPLLAKQTG